MKTSDRLWKITSFVKHIREICDKLARESNMTIDEQMLSFTDRCPTRQYVPRKPYPIILKNFVLAGWNGVVYDFEIYQGERTFQDFKLRDGSGGQGVGAVLRLANGLGPGKHVFCDRFFYNYPIDRTPRTCKHFANRNYVPVQFLF
ncbi:hypothetical protein EB796_013054 [Bugula neritina]|uniref:PiggyBac transposable element-derived protein domain-containing protein n=1 Tax=Bugula neritina TaxID=10212 RepID=A0A7J7JSM0_BUGNE|nr:hypothetical protein EB796_013054 [Bugula neritina]